MQNAAANALHAALPVLPLGAQLCILPNHACATGAQHQAYQVVRGGGTVIATWV